jgi:hypothetical protein
MSPRLVQVGVSESLANMVDLAKSRSFQNIIDSRVGQMNPISKGKNQDGETNYY